MVKDKVVSGTGHRPGDMVCKWDRLHPWKMSKIKLLKNYLEENRPSAIISGFSLGWDNWLSYVAIQLNIPLLAYLPFEGQEKLWNKDCQRQYHEMLGKAEKIKYVCEPGYAAFKMQARNVAMVKDSEAVLALWNPDKKFGGTYNCIVSALSMAKPILNFWGESPEILKGLYK